MTGSRPAAVAAEPEVRTAPAALAETPWWRRALLLGTGVAIAPGDADLEVAIVRSRPAGSRLVASTRVQDFRPRAAADWGAELSAFLAASGERGAPVTLVLPRGAVIESTLSLPGVPAKEIASAIELQIDSLHPYGDEQVAWGWSRASSSEVLVGIVRQSVLETFETLFSEAGIGLAAVTFSSAAIHAAIRVRTAAPASFLAYIPLAGSPRTEIYGESGNRAVYSARYPFPAEQAAALARDELRLDETFPAIELSRALPVAGAESFASPVAIAAALATSAPFFAQPANLLPKSRRATRSRAGWIAVATAAALLALAAIVVWGVLPAMEQRRYMRDLARQSQALERPALRAQTLERQIASARARIAAIDDLRRRPQADLDVLNELTRLLPVQAWTNTVEIYPDSVVISGEADQAASLVKVLDSSPLFQNSEFTLTHTGQTEQFRIRTMRRGRIGRTTP
jgi:general secretion pathway protein L